VALAASAATAVALWLAAPALEAYAFRMDGLAAVLRTIALGVLPLALVTVYGELLRGLSRTGTSQLVQIAAPPAWTLALLAPAVALAGREPRAAAAAYVGGAACAAAGAAWSWRRAMRATPAADPDARPRHRSEDGRTARELARAALPFLGVSLLTLALSWISMLALALRGDEAEVGVFAVAYRTATLTSFVLVAVNAAAAPRFAALVARGDRAALARIARRTVVATAGGALPLVLVAWIAPGWVLSLFGSEFAAHGRVLAILATGQLVNVLTGSVGALLMMSGHERALRRNLVGATALSLVLHAWLVPSRGPEGAAIASAVAVAVLNVASLAEVRRRLAIDVLPMPFLPAPSPETTRGANG
jgi:O-antigen/teichoic acid export membrane protein